jgi:hypothetical protein
MKKINILLMLATFLTGCGGGSDLLGFDDNDYYGSIAINQNNGKGGIIANATSQRKANDEALKLCGDSCIVVLEFGPKKCGAVSRSETAPVFGWASGNDKPGTSVASLIQCQNKGATDCKIQLSECNS